VRVEFLEASYIIYAHTPGLDPALSLLNPPHPRFWNRLAFDFHTVLIEIGLLLFFRWSSGRGLDGMCWTKPVGAGQAWTLGFRSVAAAVVVVDDDVDVPVPTFNHSVGGAPMTPPLDLCRCHHCASRSFYSILILATAQPTSHPHSLVNSL
jgi:hypothetical protein